MPCLVGPDSGCVSESHAPCDALERAFRVRSYVDVRLLLGLQATGASIRGGVPGCPADCRSRLLSALGGRLMALRYPEQSLAIRDFLASDHAAGSSGLLGELQAAALSGVAASHSERMSNPWCR